MKNKLVTIFLIILLELTSFPAQVFAQTAATASSQTTDNTLPTSSSPFLSPAPDKSQPQLDISTNSPTSAAIKTSPVVQQLTKKTYRSDENISVSIANPQTDSFQVQVLDAKGASNNVAIEQSNNNNLVTYDISPRAQFRPGKYKLLITDADGKSSQQNFSWGVLAINPDRSIYLPGQTANLAIAVLDDVGNMVCDAVVKLQIQNAKLKIDNELSTTNGKIAVNPQCQSHKFSLDPDYEGHYQLDKAGIYTMTLTAQTKNGTSSINDQLIVQDSVPFDVQRISATRIYPPNTYPVQINITANEDFTGKVTETVPDSFTITSSDNANSYNNMQTIYLNPKKDPANNPTMQPLNNATIQPSSNETIQQFNNSAIQQFNNSSSSAVLSASTTHVQANMNVGSALLLPFTGTFPITEGFGSEQTDPTLRLFYQHYGLAGHDGIDFGLPIGTPIRTTDDGVVLLSGPSDYGTTIVIQHAWGKSYYGHLTQTLVTVGQRVTKGEQIAFSGNTGEATGPHLHFGMKPNTPDLQNGYFGKIDPLPYFNLPSNAQTANGPTNNPIIQPTSNVTIQPLNNSSTSAVLGTSIEAIQPLNNVAMQQFSNGATEPSNNPTMKQFNNETINTVLTTPTTSNAEKVKILTWNVSLKKGQQISLGYTFKTPQISPQFYLLGPLRFYAYNPPSSNVTIQQFNNELVFSEKRQWQLAADAIGTPWYNNNWQYRKQITIDHTKVVNNNSASTVTFMEPGTDATQDFSFYNSSGCASSTTVAQTGPRSISCDNGTFIRKNGVLADSGSRISFYLYMTSFPSTVEEILSLRTAGSVEAFGININTSHQFSNSRTATTGSTILQAGQWYHVSLAYSIQSTTVNNFKLYLNDNLEMNVVNATLTNTVTDTIFWGRLNGTGGATAFYYDDIYIDNGNDLTDPGDIHVTNKRPNANGTFTQFTQQIGAGGSGYGSGHSPQVNEQPLSTPNGWSLTTTAKNTEEYNIESAATGDANLTGVNLVADTGWIYAKESTAANTPVSHIIVNGVATTVTLTTTAALYTNIVKNTSYLAGSGTDIGMDGQYTTTPGTYSLYEAGVLVAYYTSEHLASPVFDAEVDSAADGRTSVSFSHTVGTQSNRILVVSVSLNSNTVSSITYAGANLTKLTSINCPASSCDNEIWYKVAPATGSNTLTANFTGVSSNEVIGVASYYNVDQTTPFGTAATNTATGTAQSVSVTSTTSQLIVDSVANNSTTLAETANTNQAQMWSRNATSAGGGGSRMTGAASTTSMQWSTSGSVNWSMIGAPLNGAPSNFPVLIKLSSDTDLQAHAQSTGNDILFTDSTGQTKLNHEIENYSSGTGEMEAWVQVPTLSSITDTILYMYFGNPAASSQQNTNNTWNGNYKGVWHFAETSGNAADSTSFASTATKTGTPTQGVAGEIGNGVSFNGTTGNYFDVTNPVDGHLDFGTNSFSYSGWVNLTTAPTAGNFANWLVKKGGAGNLPGYWDAINSTPNNTGQLNDGTTQFNTPSDTLTTGTWTYYVTVVDRSTQLLHLYSNGIEVGTGASITTLGSVTTTADLDFGARGNSTPLNGKLDEVRVINGTLSAGWIKTEYNNQNSPSTYYTLGSVEGTIFAPTLDQLMRGGKWFCPASECSTNPGIQPYTF